MYRTYVIRPLEHMLSLDYPSLHIPHGFADWPIENVETDQHRIKKRWGYSEDRDLGAGFEVQHVALFQKYDGTRYTIYLTTTDIAQRETAASKTWSYKTPIGDYDSTIAEITDAANSVVTAKAGTTFDTDGIAANDYFILDTDHTSDEELDTAWLKIQAVDSETQLTLSGNYATNGTTGSWAGSEKDAIIRKVYSVPSNERWSFAIVNDNFCFSNGNVNVQKYTGSGKAADLDATNAIKARYLLHYADRLIMADLQDVGTGNRNPWQLKCSKNGDPTDWTDSTAAEYDLIDTDDFITGLGKVGSDIVVYKRDSLIFGNRTGNSTDPLAFPSQRMGLGCVAPYSIVPIRGTNVFLGADNFYILEGDFPRPIGDKVRYKFFDIMGKTEVENTWGFANPLTNQVVWIARTTEGKFGFVWDYQDMEWTIFRYMHDITGAGRGAV